MERLSRVEQQLNSTFEDEPLWFETLRAMLSQFRVALAKFDRAASRKFEGRKRARLDQRSEDEHFKTLVDTFVKTGNIN
jgi:hypothetical protein